MRDNDLSQDEVKKLLSPVNNEEVITELYSFGSMLLSDMKEHVSQIESKGAVVLGWSTGTAAFLFTQFDRLKGSLNSAIVFLSLLLAIAAIVSAYLVIRTRGDWRIPSDKDWFMAKALDSPDDLRIFHVRSLHEIKESQAKIADHKGAWLARAELALIACAAFLFVGVLVKTISPLSSYLRHAFS